MPATVFSFSSPPASLRVGGPKISREESFCCAEVSHRLSSSVAEFVLISPAVAVAVVEGVLWDSCVSQRVQRVRVSPVPRGARGV